jgi:RecA-family ATPase
MAARDYSRYQQKVIKRFYDNRDLIDDQKLSELVTSLYLATEKRKPKLWLRAKDILDRMELPQTRVDHVMDSEDPAVLAKVVEELQNGKLKRGSTKKKKPE